MQRAPGAEAVSTKDELSDWRIPLKWYRHSGVSWYHTERMIGTMRPIHTLPSLYVKERRSWVTHSSAMKIRQCESAVPNLRCNHLSFRYNN